ncbi:chorismate-binding protein [Wenyingzhuangia sp. 2_MG-2023]|uniref:chorismate-binding protein n=1 Tax=Wenyingzhuangia sp. 2_MG-2023 TaxID=3062639 RepID=UPI0026E17E54|nr:chorismate-binding protein [Wenyingzhuangia sp. 2_MG-2023]MDO6738244.1 chorismate-binding protein [Wenyingzhuangia sp. 2_MG-2023]
MKILKEIKKALGHNLPFVAFRNPNETLVTLFVQQSVDLHLFDDFSLSGYVFAPFDDIETAYLLQPDIVFTDKMEEGINLKTQKISEVEIIDAISKVKHISLVENAIKTIKNTSISKVVISRKEQVVLKDFDSVLAFEKLLYQYPNAYGYIWFHPAVGLWMGATPETLLKVKGDTFHTMALAGTQSYKGTTDVTWGNKELEEQKMVADFIKINLQNSVDKLLLSDVETVNAGNLLHLKTTITGTLKNVKDVKKIVELLHPTPAVCGLPKQESKQYILKNEDYHRSFYTGYLGEVNREGKTSLFVNLRCFTIENNHIANLYIGGGITSESNPENEWLETVAKSKVMKKILI